MEIRTSTADTHFTISLAGRFDFSSHKEFRGAVGQALAAASREIVIDFALIEYLDSSALGMLLIARDKSKEAGKTVALKNARGPAKQVLDIANFDRIFPIS